MGDARLRERLNGPVLSSNLILSQSRHIALMFYILLMLMRKILKYLNVLDASLCWACVYYLECDSYNIIIIQLELRS